MTRRGQDGAAVAFALVMIGVLSVVGLTASVVVAVVATHRRAQAAADLAALAGAGAEQDGRDACAAAGGAADENGATLDACAVEGTDVRVVVRIRLPPLLGDRVLTARARAGPAARVGTVDSQTLPSTRVTSTLTATRAGFTRGTL